MAKDDYFVIAYRILAYLYACLKAGEPVDIKYLKYGTDDFPVNSAYWEYILRHLYDDGYIEGVALVPITGRQTKGVKLTPAVSITPAGIEYLHENSTIQKAKAFLKDIKEIIPGL